MRRLVVALLLVVVFALAPRQAAATDIQRVVSPGGIEAWLVEEHSVPLVALHFAFRGGAAQDPQGKDGLADMVSTLLDEGAGEMDSQAFQTRLQELSIRLSFDAGRDAFQGQLKTLSAHADEAFDLLRRALNEPRFDSEAIERMRGQLLARLRFDREDPQDVAGRRWFELAFGAHPYGRNVEGTVETLSGISRNDIVAYAGRVFARGNLKIAVVGDIDAASLAAKLDAIFGALPAAPRLAPVEDARVAAGPVRRVVAMNQPQTVIQFGRAGLARKDPDFMAAFVANHIFGGGGFSSRLYAEVREKRGLAYSVYTYLYPLDHAALLMGGVATQNARAALTLKTIKAEMKRFAEEGPTAAELASAKSFLKGSYALRFDTSSKIAGQLLAIQLEELGIDYINTRNDQIDAVTLEDVKRVARGLFSPDDLIVSIVGRPDGLEDRPPGG